MPTRKSRNGKIHDPHEDAEDERSEFDDEHDDDKSEKSNGNPTIRRAKVTRNRLSDQVEVDPEDDEDIPLGRKMVKKTISMRDDQSASSSEETITKRSSRSARSKSMKDASSSDEDDEKLKTGKSI